MRIMAIIAIVLFGWLFVNRTGQYMTEGTATGNTVVEMIRSRSVQQAAVSAYGILFAIVVLLQGLKRSSVDEAKDMTILSELRDKGLINDIEYETAKKRITGI